MATPLTFTQQLQRQGKLHSRNNPFLQSSVMMNSRPSSSGNGSDRQLGGRGVTHKSVGMLRHAQDVNELHESHHFGKLYCVRGTECETNF